MNTNDCYKFEGSTLKLRQPFPGEKCRMSMDHDKMTFTWKSEVNGDDLELPNTVKMLMEMRGMWQIS